MWYTRSVSTPTTAITTPSRFLTPQRALIGALLLIALLALLLFLAPAERQLGNLIKVIYLHGALARVGMLGLMIAGALGLLYLLRPSPSLLAWSNAIQIAGLVFFVAHFVLSVIPTRATWGMWIAFDEPRTRMSLQIIGVGLIVVVVRHLLNDHRLSALANLLLGVAVLIMDIGTGVLRHPLNPIGDSTSNAIQLYYGGIMATCLALMILLTWALVATRRAKPAG